MENLALTESTYYILLSLTICHKLLQAGKLVL